MDSSLIAQERARRRTFAIISHPDAGKTTLTEKLLLYSGMVRTAGMVRGRKGAKAASSDWMAMEQERGISITASAMQFPYKENLINVLDTPGHQDFSEDTYRTLTAADSVIMVIDAGKGVEEQTRKLFKVCRLRNIPILTFVNKLDLPARDRLELLEEVEDVLGIDTAPINWPIGHGKNFCGIVDLVSRYAYLYKRGLPGGAVKVETERVPLDDLERTGKIDPELLREVLDELELVSGAGTQFSPESYLKCTQTPVFFGSALTNFGVEDLFDKFSEIAPAPRKYMAIDANGESIGIDPDAESFSGYVFKIQANMNPKHRDSMAFIRVCSGSFERDMQVIHHRTGKRIRLSRSYTLKAGERDTVDAAYPGDIVGVINPGVFAIGDTISMAGAKFNFPPMPQFPPEVVARIRAKDVLKLKSFRKGISQLTTEGAVQLLYAYNNREGDPYIAAVGRLQFEVLQHRLLKEYSTETDLDMLSYRFSNYLVGNPETFRLSGGSILAVDTCDRVVVLCTSEWEVKYLQEQNPDHSLKEFLA